MLSETPVCHGDIIIRLYNMDDDGFILKEVEVASGMGEKNDQECNRFFQKSFEAAVGLDWLQPECLLLLLLISHLMPLLAPQLLSTASDTE